MQELTTGAKMTRTKTMSSEKTEGKNILLVDDEEMLAEITKELLEHFGYRVTVCNKSEDALEKFSEAPESYDLIITDQTMPGMSGTDLAVEIFTLSPDTPIILCTGYNEDIIRKKAESSGIQEFLMKPITIEELDRTINRALKKKQHF